MLDSLYDSVFHLFNTINYGTVFIMMILEASIFPVPSEIPMIAIGMQSAAGTMNPVLGITIGLLGIFIGTTINYYIGYFIGDVFVEKYGKYFFIKKSSYHRAQQLFNKDANYYTFFGRLIPVVRHLISIPAGMAHMPYGRFIGLSLLGSSIWLTILVTLGYFIGDNEALIKQYITSITIGIILCAVLFFLYKHRKWYLERNRK